LAGAFSHEVHTLRDALIHLRMLVEATLDFPEEEIDFLKKADAEGQLSRLMGQLTQVRAQAQQGALLRQGVTVVIAGQPNAGKSSLLNALAGAELAIVTPIAGTTRDVVQQTIQIEGVPVHVIDTAGLRESPEVDVVEQIGIERAWDQIRQADAVLFLHDLTRCNEATYQADDAAIAAALPSGVQVLHVGSKRDQVSAEALAQRLPEGALALSAFSGEGLTDLRQRLLQWAGWQPASEGVFMARERHLQALARVDSHLTQAQLFGQQIQMLGLCLQPMLRLAQQALGEITGEFTADDLLGEIFSRFCIGK
jgi:tRNA modification GTPase